MKNKTGTVADTLKYCLMTYPSLFPNKWEVYHHWFIVNGNGLSWVNGQLVDPSHVETPSTIEDAVNIRFKKLLERDSLLEYALRFTIEYAQKDIIRIINWESAAQVFEPSTRNNNEFYGLSEYSRILRLPDNIQPDWLEAAKEMYEWMKANPGELSEEDHKYISQINLPL